MKGDPSEQVRRRAASVFASHEGTLRTREALAEGVHPSTLYWMRDHGELEQLTRGVYRLANLSAPAKYDVVAVMERVPSAVLCLLSALDFHGVGDHIPSAVYMAIGPKDRAPRLAYPPVRVYRMSGHALTAGVETHQVDGTIVRVFGIAKTVADCFKFRNKIGYDVGVEALQEVIREKRATPAQIMEFATIDRVAKVIRPYLEALQ